MSASVELQLLDSFSRVMDPDPDLDPTSRILFSGSLFAVVIIYLAFLLFISPLRCVTLVQVQISNPGVLTLHVHCALQSIIIIVDDVKL